MGRHDAGPVTDAIHHLDSNGVHRQLHGEIHRGDQGDLLQRQVKISHEGQEEQRGEVVHDRLGDVADVAGVNRVIVAFADGGKHEDPSRLLSEHIIPQPAKKGKRNCRFQLTRAAQNDRMRCIPYER